MIARLHLFARLLSFAAALWILALVVWGLATGAKHLETPLLAVWLFIAATIAQLALWLLSKAVRRP
jgi:hypothetical protein